jgi:2,3-bisphosphoglycerate-independent phosphoglycerate mutase
MSVLNYDWKPLTFNDIQNRFFNRSRSFTKEALRLLEEHGFIEVKRSEGKTFLNGKFIVDTNRYRLVSTLKEKVNIQDSGVSVTFHYKGFKQVTEVITINDKSISTEVKQILKDSLNEDLYVKGCEARGMSKEKAWFLYNKIMLRQR